MRTVSSILCPLVLFALESSVCADVNFPDFTSNANLNLQGSAGTTSGVLRLTPDQNAQAGSAWFDSPQQVSLPFVCQFDFRWLGTPGADGFAFVIQNSSATALGGSGCELGYHGITNGLAVEIDSWQNMSCAGVPSGDPSQVHLSVHSSGTGPLSVGESTSLGSTTLLPDLEDGSEHRVRIEYVPGTMLVFVDDLGSPALSVSVDLASSLQLNAGQAWVGFTAGTGGAAQAHDIHTWGFLENTGPSGGNSRPRAPTITEPEVDGQQVNPFDVHMETSPFSDADVLDQHLCTDWEIWNATTAERVWFSDCASGPEAVHAHMGDGVFGGSLAGQTSLEGSTSYVLRVRHSDDSGDAFSRWSEWSVRQFVTGAASQVFELEMDDVIVPPAPIWRGAGAEVILPAGLQPPTLSLESQTGQLLVSLTGFDDSSNIVQDGDELAVHAPVRLVLDGGSTGIVLPESDFTVTDHECETHTLLLPALTLAPNEVALFWVSFDGSTYFGAPGQTSPDFGSLARGQDFPWVAQEGFEVDVVAGGFQLPVNLCFLPNPGPAPTDPLFYVTELYGTIKVVDRAGTVSVFASGLLDFMRTGAFPGSGEQGLAGIAIDPLTGDVYAGMLHDSVTNPGVHYPKVVRFTSLDGGRTAATETTILDMVGEAQGQSHQISHLEIHPDGKLIVHMGDGFVASTARNLSSFRGKILRMNLDGSAAVDNPFYDAGNGITARDYVWAYGIRNAFGGAYRHADGFHYSVENGPSVDRISRILPGLDLGWDGSNTSMTVAALHNWAPAVGPVNIAFIEPEVFGGSGFPAEFHGRGYVSESGPTYAAGGQSNGRRISQWIFDMSGDLSIDPEDPYLLEYVGVGRATVVGLAAGPDGLYMTELYADGGNSPVQSGARVLRIRHTGGVDCNENGVPDVCDLATGSSIDLDQNGVPDECTGAGSFCAGDGGDQMLCTPCPCGNDAVPGSPGGCINSAGRSARMLLSGLASASNDSVRIEVRGASDSTFGFLTSGVSRAPTNPANPCFGLDSGLSGSVLDGLRCVVQGVLRHGTRASDVNGAIGETTAGWGPPNGPAGGVLAQAGMTAGQTRHFQVYYRDNDQTMCMTGVNTTDAATIVVGP